MKPAALTFERVKQLSTQDYIACLGASSLGAQRPLSNATRVRSMLDHSDLVIVAREDDRVVGICRCITDWSWVAYCADLAVIKDRQGRGIGRGLLDEAASVLGPDIGIALLSVEEAKGFYRQIGMNEADGFWLERLNSK